MRGPVLRLLSGAFTLFITATALSTNKNLKIKGDYVAGNLPQIDADGETLKWVAPGTLGGGSVSSVGLVLPAIFTVSNSPVTTAGTLTAVLANQAPNLFFAGPGSGGSAAPTFRAIVAADLPIGSTAGTVAAGNDARLHTQGSDLGTTSPTFQIQTGAAGAKLKNNAGAIEIRNEADTAYADLVVKNLVVQGTTTTVNSETVDIADSQITLNSNFASGSPTENGGIAIKRGSLTDASILWNEGTDRWQAGILGAEIDLPRQRKFAITNAGLTAGSIAITHDLNNQHPDYRVYDNGNKPVEPADVTGTSVNVMTFDLNGVTVAGTWTIVITG
jgi:hypothetical protein